MTTVAPLHAYRHLLKAAQIAFQGDVPVLTAARQRAREAFEQNRTLASDSKDVVEGVKHAEEVAQFLRTNVVQGEKQTGEGEGLYRLRIHDEVERGDNEDIKKGRGKRDIGSGPVKCCSEK